MTYLTEITITDPFGFTRTFAGPYIEAESEEKASEWLRDNLPYASVVGRAVCDVDADLMEVYQISMN